MLLYWFPVSDIGCMFRSWNTVTEKSMITWCELWILQYPSNTCMNVYKNKFIEIIFRPNVSSFVQIWYKYYLYKCFVIKHLEITVFKTFSRILIVIQNIKSWIELDWMVHYNFVVPNISSFVMWYSFVWENIFFLTIV